MSLHDKVPNADKQKDHQSYQKRRADYWFTEFDAARKRHNVMADKFVSLEVQIASFLLAFSLFFDIRILQQETFRIKLLFTFGWIFLTISLILGLLTVSDKKAHLHQLTDKLHLISAKWNKVLQGKMNFETAEEVASALLSPKESSSNWTWRLQTLCLFLGLTSLIGALMLTIF